MYTIAKKKQILVNKEQREQPRHPFISSLLENAEAKMDMYGPAASSSAGPGVDSVGRIGLASSDGGETGGSERGEGEGISTADSNEGEGGLARGGMEGGTTSEDLTDVSDCSAIPGAAAIERKKRRERQREVSRREEKRQEEKSGTLFLPLFFRGFENIGFSFLEPR
jgi:hypothetical protein